MIMRIKTKRRLGFTLIELIIVMASISILSAIGMLRLHGLVEQANQIVCIQNRKQFEIYYNANLDLREIEHSPEYFDQLMEDMFNGKTICPSQSNISYDDGKVKCSIHSEDNNSDQEEKDEPEDVPYL